MINARMDRRLVAFSARCASNNSLSSASKPGFARAYRRVIAERDRDVLCSNHSKGRGPTCG